MKTKHITLTILTLVTFSLFFAGCYSLPKEIPSGLSADELILLAQTSQDEGNTRAAELYYEAIIIRFGENKSLVVEAEYEIAHLKIKDKKWSQAIPDLERILSYYDEDDAYMLPSEYKKLAQIDYAKIPKAELKKYSSNN